MNRVFSFAVCCSILFGPAAFASAANNPGDAPAQITAKTLPAGYGLVYVTEGDVTDRPYRTIGPVKVTVTRKTSFSAAPTNGQVDEKLRREAKRLGADAVIQVKYGPDLPPGNAVTNWTNANRRTGYGLAVRFVEQ